MIGLYIDGLENNQAHEALPGGAGSIKKFHDTLVLLLQVVNNI